MKVETAVSEFLTYLRTERSATKETISSYRNDLTQFATHLATSGQPTDIERITPPVLRRFLATIQAEKDLSGPTMARKIATLRSFFSYLVSQEYLDRNPALILRTPPKPQRIPVYLTEPELKRLFAAAERSESPWAMRDLLVLKLLAHTGVRRSELVGADWNDVDFGRRELTVRKGKRNKQRVIPLTEELTKLLWEYLQTRLPLTDPALLLGNWRTRISKRLINAIVAKYAKKAGIDKKITAHKLRHTFATLLVEKDVDLFSVQKLLGHNDISTTQIYAHVGEERLRDAVSRLQS